MPDDSLIGFQTDTLKFESLLGKGAMGAVYKGTQLALDRPVAIKVIAPHLANDQAYRERFSREAQTLGKVLHPNVIACHDIGPCLGPNGEQLFVMVLEFVDGWSLGSLLKQKRLSVRQVLELHRQAADGLQAAHNLGIVHRDIKPDNIMVTRQGQAKLADFGLAKADDSAGLTQTGALMGSPSYMSPEACRGEPPMSSSDLYSLGCSLFFSLSGTTPFSATSALQAIQQHVNAPVPALSSRRADLAPLDALLQRCLAKHPTERHADASGLADAIRACVPLFAPDVFVGGGTIPVSESVAISPTQVSGQRATVTLATSARASQTGATLPIAGGFTGGGTGGPAQPSTLATQASAAPRRTWWPMILTAGLVAAVIIILLIANAGKKPGPLPTPGATMLEASFARIESLYNDGNLTEAQRQLTGLDIPDGNAALLTRRDILRKAIADKQALLSTQPLAEKLKAEQQKNTQLQATQTQSEEASLAAIADDITQGGMNLEIADRLLKQLVVSGDELTQRKAKVQMQLDAAWAQMAMQIQADLDQADRDLTAKNLSETNKILKKYNQGIGIPDRFPELRSKRDEIAKRYNLLRLNPNLATPSEAPQPAKAIVTIVHPKSGTLRASSRPEVPGVWSLPFCQPLNQSASEALIQESVESLADPRPTIVFSLPPTSAPHNGVLALVYDGESPGRDLKVERLNNERIIDTQTIHLIGQKWELISIPIDGEPASDLRLSAANNGLGERNNFYVAKAAFGSGAIPTFADLDLVPGTLERFVSMKGEHTLLLAPKERDTEGFFADLKESLIRKTGAINPISFKLAVPATWKDRSGDVAKALKRTADSLSRAVSAPIPASTDEHTHVLYYTNTSTIKSVFDTAGDAGVQVLFVMISLDQEPRQAATDMAQYYAALVKRGTLPVLVISPTPGQPAPPSLIKSWTTYFTTLRETQIGLPLLDLADVPHFYQVNKIQPALPVDSFDLQLDGLEAGVHELVTRIDWALKSHFRPLFRH
jgi:predicted Ser/Thr protein kinase